MAAAKEHAEGLLQQPGCVAAHVLRERGTSIQVSLSIFESEEEFDQAMEVTHPIIAKHHIEQFVEEPSTFRVFEVL